MQLLVRICCELILPGIILSILLASSHLIRTSTLYSSDFHYLQLKANECSALICLLPKSQQAASSGFQYKHVQLQNPVSSSSCMLTRKCSLPDKLIYKGSYAPMAKRIQATCERLIMPAVASITDMWLAEASVWDRWKGRKRRSLTGRETIIYLELGLALVSASRVSQGSRTWLHWGIHKEKLKIQPKQGFEEPRGHCLSLKYIKE